MQAMTRLMESSENLMKVVDNVNERISNLAASTEEIAASATMIGQVAAELHDKLTESIPCKGPEDLMVEVSPKKAYNQSAVFK